MEAGTLSNDFKKQNPLLKKRITYLDVARTLAIVCVALNHSVNRAYRTSIKLNNEFLNLPFFSAVLQSVAQIISRMGVPMFLMISGVLLLNKEIKDSSDIKRFYKNNLLPLLITFEIWIFITQFGIGAFTLIQIPTVQTFWIMLEQLALTMLFLRQSTIGAFWYMPMILCVYLVIPFFAMIIKKISPKYILIPSAVVLMCSFAIPNFNACLALNSVPRSFVSVLTSDNVFSFRLLYVFVGYYIGQGALKKIKNSVMVSVTVAVFLLSCAYQFFVFTKPYYYIMGYNSLCVFILSACLFEIVRRFCDKENKFTPTFQYIAKISFGMYFVHVGIIAVIQSVISIFKITMPSSLRLLLLFAVSLSGSVLFIYLLSKIKLCKRYLFLIKG